MPHFRIIQTTIVRGEKMTLNLLSMLNLPEFNAMINYSTLRVKIDLQNRKEIYFCHLFVQPAFSELSLLEKGKLN